MTITIQKSTCNEVIGIYNDYNIQVIADLYTQITQ